MEIIVISSDDSDCSQSSVRAPPASLVDIDGLHDDDVYEDRTPPCSGRLSAEARKAILRTDKRIIRRSFGPVNHNAGAQNERHARIDQPLEPAATLEVKAHAQATERIDKMAHAPATALKEKPHASAHAQATERIDKMAHAPATALKEKPHASATELADKKRHAPATALKEKPHASATELADKKRHAPATTLEEMPARADKPLETALEEKPPAPTAARAEKPPARSAKLSASASRNEKSEKNEKPVGPAAGRNDKLQSHAGRNGKPQSHAYVRSDRLSLQEPPKLDRGRDVMEDVYSDNPRERIQAERAKQVRLATEATADIDWKASQSRYQLLGHTTTTVTTSVAVPTSLPASRTGKSKKQQKKKRARLILSEQDDYDEESDSDFTPAPAQLTLAGPVQPERRAPRVHSIKYLLESTKHRWNLPRPSIRDPPARTARREYELLETSAALVPASWPYWVMHVADSFNPDQISVPGEEPFQKCYCLTECRFDTCASARTAFYCDEWSCRFKGLCGNGTRTNEHVRLMRVKNTDIYTLQATRSISCGVVLGEYLGVLSLVPGEKEKREKNEGFRLHFKKNPYLWGSQDLCVDANVGGSLMRFLNHSCRPTARFQEHTNVGGRTMVAVTVRYVHAGEELTVDYGHDLWFDCTCDLCLSGESSRKKKA